MDLLAAWSEIYSSGLTGDIDGSCSVDQTDISLVQATFGTSWAQGDVDGDGTVGASDLGSILANFGEVCE